MKTLWKIYYRLTIGQEKLDEILSNARVFNMNLKQSTKGDLNHFYDMDGQQIRGWHKRTISFKRNNQHPLIQKYQ